MKKGLLGSTALVGATAMMAGAAGAAEAPTWKLTGNMNFQAYYVDQDFTGFHTSYLNIGGVTKMTSFPIKNALGSSSITTTTGGVLVQFRSGDRLGVQDHGWYFGVDEAELQLNVAGTADNGLNYGFKIEINANTTDTKVADEARLQLSGGWGTLQMGDEDGAEDIMNYGGENLMGATGGFDGDQDDVLIRGANNATSYPTIAGDTSDSTKLSYFSPRFSGFQVGASLTPNPSLNGDNFKQDGAFENHYGLGANYDNSFGGVRVRASAVYSAASSNNAGREDIGAYSVGAIVGFGPVSVGANYTDNSDSGAATGSGDDSTYWDVAASFETGPLYLSVGYLSSTYEFGGGGEDTFDNISLTADYSVAPGLGVYAELQMISDDPTGTFFDNDATIFIAGANVSF
jgi:hypothetical protein